MRDKVYGSAVTSPDSDVENCNGYKLPPHLLKLPQGRWALWRCAGLRGAGFPITELAKASTPICARQADVVLRCESETQQARSEAIAALRRLETGTKHQRRAVEKTIRRLQRNNSSIALEAELAGVQALAEFCRAQGQLEAALLDYRQAFDSDSNHLSEEVKAIATAERFREAVIWQNHSAFHNTIETLLRQSGANGKGWKQRRREEVVANYLQRYCAKNDTIGFFGPVGWVSFVDNDEPVNLQNGPGLIASRQVYFEGWCIDALAQKLGEEKGLRPWIAPRVRPSVRREGNILRLPFGAEIKLIPDHAIILQACDGKRAAKRIAEELIGSLSTIRDEQSVYSVLDFMCSRKLIFWALHLPIEAHPEQTLRRLLEQIGDAEVRESALAKLDQMIKARKAVSAAGSAEELDRAMCNLEETFTRLTGAAPRRPKGNTYARGLVYEDCRRDLKLEIGKKLLQTLAPPLHLVLKSARWLTARAFELYRAQFEAIYRRLATANKSPHVDIASFWMEIQPLINQRKGEPLDTLVEEFQQHWSRIFGLSNGQRHLHYSTEDIQPKVSALFDTSDEIARYVRYHSPDLMIAAKSVEAMQRDDYQFVLGELHVAVNTLSYLMFVEQHPAPEEFALAWNADIPERRVLPVLPKDFFGGAMRTKLISKTARDFFLDFANESPDPNPEAVPFSEFVIEESASGLIVHSIDGRLHFDGMHFFAMAVIGIVVNCFKIAGRERYVPRVSIDRLVVRRESWSFAASELDFANESDETARFLAIRRWAKHHQMPRYIFVTSPCERKPFYVDFDSTIYTCIFAKVVRHTSQRGADDEVIGITEMLPSPDNLWLTDAENNRYTSELRIVALDLAGWK